MSAASRFCYWKCDMCANVWHELKEVRHSPCPRCGNDETYPVGD